MKRSDRNWTIVSVLYTDPHPISEKYPFGRKSRCERYIVLDPLKSNAEKIVQAWLKADPSRTVNLEEIYYYPRNYVDMACDLKARGRIIT